MMKSTKNPFSFKQSEINWYSWEFEKLNPMQWFSDVLTNQMIQTQTESNSDQTAWNEMHQMDL